MEKKMNLDDAIEQLRRLPPSKQAKVFRIIEEEATDDLNEVPRFLRTLHENPIEDWPSDLSENRGKFTGI